jgi:hypothetical protein
MSIRTPVKFAWGLLLLLATIVLFGSVTPPGGKLLVEHPYLSAALACFAVLCLTAWAGRIWMPLRRLQLDWQILSAIAVLALVGAGIAWLRSDQPTRSVLTAAGGLAFFFAITRRIHVGEIDHIAPAKSGSDRTVWICLLPLCRFKNPKDWVRWGLRPLPAVVKLRIVKRKRNPPRRDDRVFRIEQKGLVECVVRTKTGDPECLDDQAFVVVVYGFLGDWCYIVGGPVSRPGFSSDGTGIHCFFL